MSKTKKIKSFSESFYNKRLAVAAWSIQGKRMYQEDQFHIQPALWSSCRPEVPFTAVFDGHSGSHVAKFASKYFAEYLSKRIPVAEQGVNALTNEAIEESFMSFDQKTTEFGSGCTANVIMYNYTLVPASRKATVKQEEMELICANIGDSKAILYNNGSMITMSNEHVPCNPVEAQRIEAAGAKYDKQSGRLEGGMNISRSFGDFKYKSKPVLPREQPVTALPEIKRFKLTGFGNQQNATKLDFTNMTPEKATFVLQASDGLWDHDAYTDKELIEFTLDRMNKYKLFDEGYQVKLEDLYMHDPLSWRNKPLKNWTEADWNEWKATQGLNYSGNLSTLLSDFLTSEQDATLLKALAKLQYQLFVQQQKLSNLPKTIHDKLELVCEDLTRYAEIKSTDNITVAITLVKSSCSLEVATGC